MAAGFSDGSLTGSGSLRDGTELSNPRTVPALVDRLEHDPSPFIRKEVASRMLTLLAREPLVRSALQASAAEDEDRMVRGASFYALRLDLDRDPGREALARWPRNGGSAALDSIVDLGILARAGDGNRTRMTSLEGWSSAIELRPQQPPRYGAAVTP